MIKNIFSIFVFLLVGFATATGPQFQRLENTPKDGAILYMYRGDFGGNQSAYTPDLLINDIKVVELKRNAYTYIYLSPGKYKLSFRNNIISGYPDLDGEFEVSAGQRKFMKIFDPVSASGTVITYTSSIREMDENSALKEISSMRFDAPIVPSIEK
jgi:hypothetical protein